MSRRIVLSVLATLLAANASYAQLGDLLRKIDPNKVKKSAQVLQAATIDFTPAQEADIGRMISARVLATYPLAKNDKLQRYVTLVGNTVAAYSARPELEWHFSVLESDVVNAFSAPGGFIFITTGALNQMHSEAELASVLGHEIAHATQKHILKEVKRANVVASAKDLAESTSQGAQWLDNDLGHRISNVAYEKLFTTGLSRRDEGEADAIGAQLAASAGYDATSFITFLEGLRKLEGTSALKQLTSTHPSPEDRIKTLRPTVKSGGATLAERFGAWTAAK